MTMHFLSQCTYSLIKEAVVRDFLPLFINPKKWPEPLTPALKDVWNSNSLMLTVEMKFILNLAVYFKDMARKSVFV